MRYITRSKFLQLLSHKKTFHLIWQAALKLEQSFCQLSQDTTFEFEYTRKKAVSDNYSR